MQRTVILEESQSVALSVWTPGCSPYAMYIILNIAHVVKDDVGYVWNAQPSAHDVGCHQQFEFPALELIKCPQSLVLGTATVHIRSKGCSRPIAD